MFENNYSSFGQTEENAICHKTDVKIVEEKLESADIDVAMVQEKITKPAKKFACKECGMGFDKPCLLEYHKGYTFYPYNKVKESLSVPC